MYANAAKLICLLVLPLYGVVSRYDKDHSGTIDAWELRQVLESMGQKPSDEEIFNLIATVDEDMSQTIDFPEFLTVIQRQLAEAERAKVRVVVDSLEWAARFHFHEVECCCEASACSACTCQLPHHHALLTADAFVGPPHE